MAMNTTHRHNGPGRGLLIAGLVLASLAARPCSADDPAYHRRWFYSAFNLQVEANADRLIDLIERAGKAGYNGMVLADYKFNVLDRVIPAYGRNAARVRESADRAGVEIIPAVFPIGYSSGLLAHDPNLAEGLPVKDALFLVNGREAALVPDPDTVFRNGSLEETNGNHFTRFSFQDDPGKATVADLEVAHQGQVSCRMRDTAKVSTSANARLIQKVKVRPHACYQFSAWVKTKDFQPNGEFRLLALGASEGGRPLTFYEGKLKPTQDWTRISVVFNSLDQNEVNLYVGLWGGADGTLWIDDLGFEELSMVNVLRRPGCPLTVKSADGATTYVEGRDYLPVADPKLGQVPYAGEFSFDHPPAPLRVATGSRIKDGETLKVSWYHPVLVHGNQVACCLTEPKVYDLLRDQARRVNDLLHPKTFFMSHDELRVANWCRACQATGRTPGQLLADNVRECTAILNQFNPRAEVVVWSDMFDPNHNAVKSYYLVNGTLAGSWEGLVPQVIVANWNSGKAEASLRFFADRGHRQVLAGFYDAGIDNFRQWDQAARGVKGVDGFMYTTWQANYSDLDAFGKAMRRAK
ncbi:MAG: hypothetical protein ABI353_23590 [Isosphaeraceae bacterium]